MEADPEKKKKAKKKIVKKRYTKMVIGIDNLNNTQCEMFEAEPEKPKKPRRKRKRTSFYSDYEVDEDPGLNEAENSSDDLYSRVSQIKH